jgi:hypothetical protein
VTGGFIRYAPTAGASRWLLIAGRRFVAAVESTASDSIVDAVFWLAGSDLATIESVVGAFPLTGPDAVRSFAVAEIAEPNAAGDVTVTAVVRGGAAVDVFSVGGARRFSAGGVQPWVLAEFRSVSGLVLQGDDAPTGPVARLAIGSLPLGIGVADGELLTWTLTPIERASRGTSAVAPAPTAGEHAGADALSGPAAEETIIRDPNVSSSLFGHVGDGGEEDIPPEAHPAPHELAGAVDIDEPALDTGTAVRAAPPAAAGVPLTTPYDDGLAPTQPVVLPPRPATFAARLPTGETVALATPLLIGRRPAVQRVGSPVAPRLVTVISPTQEVSSTHVQIEQTGDAVVVTDLRSTNGTVIVEPGGRRRLRPGESAVVLAGAKVEIGDGNIIEITARREEGRE